MYQLRDYQQEPHDKTIQHCRETHEPAFHDITVGGGKSILIAFAMMHVINKGGRALMITRQGELVQQNSDDYFDMGGKCSVFSASLNRKSTYYPCVMGTEGTIYRALKHEFKDLKFDLLTIDECLTGDTLIKTENGYMRIDDQDLKNNKIYCFDESTKEIKLDYPVRVFSNGTRDVSYIRFKNGDEIKCTGNHKIYTENSWVQARNLNIGQKITLDGSKDFVLKKLLRASVGVVKKLVLLLAQKAH